MKYRVEIKKTEWLTYEIEAPSEHSAFRCVEERGGAGAVPYCALSHIEFLHIEPMGRFIATIPVRVKR